MILIEPASFARTRLLYHLNAPIRGTICRRFSTPTSPGSKYAEKLRRLAAEKGLSIDELKVKAREVQESDRQRLREELLASAPKIAQARNRARSPSSSWAEKAATPSDKIRRDCSPVKPLSSILNLPRIFSSPHSTDQVSALWTAYHTTRPGGGCICASIPADMYTRMISVAQKYPSFVIPLPREGSGDKSCEFYFMQWGFHGSPPSPTFSLNEPFVQHTESATAEIPPTTTILFTPLQEYKHRASFATPYLVVTNHTDLALTHDTVLLRGEITSGAGSKGTALLSQTDARMLVLAVQNFYLWGGTGEGEADGEGLVRLFHERPEDFKWEELLKHANVLK